MNKEQLIDEIFRSTNSVTKKQTLEVVDAFLQVVKRNVAQGEKVLLVGFGSFFRADRKEKKARNPKTGEEIMIPAMTVPRFSAGKKFKDEVRSN